LPDSFFKLIIRRVVPAAIALPVAMAISSPVLAQSAEALARQRAEYDAVEPKSVVNLQMFRQETLSQMPETGAPFRFVSLNPAVNSWFLVQIGEDGSRKQQSYHFENPNPLGQTVELLTTPILTLALTDETGRVHCAPWVGESSVFEQARATEMPYAPICNGRLYLRNKVSGSRTGLERTAEFLRNNVWGGEKIVGFVRHTFFRDSEFESGAALAFDDAGELAGGPGAALVNGSMAERRVISTRHGFLLDGTEAGEMTLGLWYPVSGLPDVFASAFQPRAISDDIINGPGLANRLDSVESRATGYMVAFDLGKFELGFALGTDHPGVGWSSRPPASVRPRGMPGPDGINSVAPLVRLGMVSPALTERLVATFTAGFKRQHGAFKYGDYPTLNYGTHYGFIEQGVVLSKLQPNLSTLLVMQDGSIDMRTWQEADNALLPQIRFARQNGVPLIERDPETGLYLPGPRVTQWGPGNWSGSANADLRTLRAGACIKETDSKRFLIYGYFSTATPSAMARSFQAYGCQYAMLLDMNALEHTYLALYVRQNDDVHVEHLIPGMSAIDKSQRDGTLIPRFVGFADNRDLFYLTRREDSK